MHSRALRRAIFLIYLSFLVGAAANETSVKQPYVPEVSSIGENAKDSKETIRAQREAFLKKLEGKSSTTQPDG